MAKKKSLSEAVEETRLAEKSPFNKEGVKSFIKDAVTNQGVEFNDDVSNEILNKYGYDYDRLVDDIGRSYKIPESNIEGYRNDIYNKYGFSRPDEFEAAEMEFVRKPVAPDPEGGYEKYKELQDELTLAQSFIGSIKAKQPVTPTVPEVDVSPKAQQDINIVDEQITQLTNKLNKISQVDTKGRALKGVDKASKKLLEDNIKSLKDKKAEILKLEGVDTTIPEDDISQATISPTDVTKVALPDEAGYLEPTDPRILDLQAKADELEKALREQSDYNMKKLGFASEAHQAVKDEMESYIPLLKEARQQRLESKSHVQRTEPGGYAISEGTREANIENLQRIKDLDNLTDIYRDMGKLMGAPKGEGFDKQAKALFYGLGNNFFTKDFVSLGLNEFSKLSNVKQAFDTRQKLIDEGKTEEEIAQTMPSEELALLNTYQMLLELQATSDPNTLYYWGEGLKEMIPFIAQFAATGGIGAGAKKAVSAYVKQRTKSQIAGKIAGAITKPLVQSAAMIPANLQGYAERVAPTLDEEGRLVEGMNPLKATVITYANTVAEVVGEDVGTYLNKTANKAARESYRRMIGSNPNKAQQFLGKMALSLTRDTNIPTIQGVVFEGLGEEVTGILQAVINQDDSFFTSEAQKQIWGMSLIASGTFMSTSVPRRLKTRNDYSQARKLLDDIPNGEYATSIESLSQNYDNVEDLTDAWEQLNKQFGNDITEEDKAKARTFIEKSVVFNQMNTARAIRVEEQIAQSVGQDGNVTLAQYEGKPYSVRNPQDLGKEGKVIMLKDTEGNVTPVISSKITDWDSKPPEQIVNEHITLQDQQDSAFEAEQQAQEETLAKAQEKGLEEGKTVITPQGKKTLVSVNPDGTSIVVNEKGEEAQVNTDEIEAYKTQEQKDAEKAELEGQEVVSDEPLFEGSDVRVIDYANGTGIIITPEGEQPFETKEERDAVIEALASAELEAAQAEELTPEQAFAETYETDPEIAAESLGMDIESLRTQSEEARAQAKEVQSKKERITLLKQAKELEVEAQRLEQILADPTLLEVAEPVVEEEVAPEEVVEEPPVEEVAERTPDIIHAEYQQEQEMAPINQLLPWQEVLLTKKVNPDSFIENSDEANVTPSMKRAWFTSKDETSKNLDLIAQEISDETGMEITEQDIVEFIIDNPTASVRKTTDAMLELQREYKDVTGQPISKHEVAPTLTEEELAEIPFRTAPEGIQLTDKAQKDLAAKTRIAPTLAKLQDTFGIPVSIINSDEMPEHVKEAAGKKKILPSGFYDPSTATAYILSDIAKTKGIAEIKKTYMHEAVLHKGLDVLFEAGPVKVLGKSFETKNDLLDEVYSRLDKETIADRAKYYAKDVPIDQFTDQQKRELAEEAMATLNETESPRLQVFLDKLYNYIRKLFGFTTKQFSKAEFRDLLREHRDLIIKQKEDAEAVRIDEGRISEAGIVQEKRDAEGREDIQQPEEGRAEARVEEGVKFQAEPAGQVDSENFKKWFGDSKVIDENGKPRVVFHGTNADFSSFDPKYQTTTAHGYGFYFATDKSVAEGYRREGEGKLIDAYLSIEKPLDDNASNFSINQIKQIIKEALNLELETYADEMESYKDSFLSNIVDTYSISEESAISETADMLSDNDSAVDMIAELSNIMGSRQTPQLAVKNTLGYDGIFVKDFQETDGDVYIAWFPNQIKSATENTGEFSETNPDIRFRAIGEYGADRLDMAEEVTTRLDNLEVAKKMDKEGIQDSFDKARLAHLKFLELNEKEDYTTDREPLIEDRDNLYRKLGYPTSYNVGDRDFHKQVNDALESNDISKLPKSKGDLSIKQATGWEKGSDGKWRYEVPDAIVTNFNRLKEVKKNALFEHDKIDNINYEINPDGTYNLRLRGKDATSTQTGFIEYSNLRKNELNTFLGDEIASAIKKGDAAKIDVTLDFDEGISYEISGKEFDIEPENGIPLKDIITDKTLFKEYPSLNDIIVYFDKKKGRGASYIIDGANEYIRLGTELPITPNVLNRVINHEIQHAIQQLEGFSQGGSPSQFRREVGKAYNIAKQKGLIGKDLTDQEINIELYRSLAGEVEARNVEKRFGLKPDEIRESLMVSTEDISREDQLFIKDSIMSLGEPKFRVAETQQELDDFVKDSKVKETVYHGTPTGGFTEFDEAKKGTRTGHDPEDVGYHFTNDKEYASAYSLEYRKAAYPILMKSLGYIPDHMKVSDMAMTYNVRLNMANPMPLPHAKIDRETIAEAKEKGYDSIIGKVGENTADYVVFSPDQILIEPKEDVKFKVEEEREKVETSPSEKQIEAGNYQKGHLQFDGFDISIENPRGSIRKGTNEKGEEWSNIMPADYGYFKGTIGKDKDHIDVFLGDNLESDKVYVVDQVNPETGAFDEHKVLMGYNSISEARNAYMEGYEEGWQGLGAITRTTKDGLKEWFKGDTKKPFRPIIDDVKFQVAPPTDSKEFKKWFGDSKVVNEKGEPLVVYHGTDKEFKVFSKEEVGKRTQAYSPGFYFTHDPDVASEFSELRKSYLEMSGQNIIPAYLSLQNPKQIDYKGKRKDSLKNDITEAQEAGHDGFIGTNVGDSVYSQATWKLDGKILNIDPRGSFDELYDDVKSGEISTKEAREDWIDPMVEYLQDEIESTKDQATKKQLEDELETWLNISKEIDNNFKNIIEDATGRTNIYVAFEPNQIKSATGNIGSYDPKQADIRFQVKSDDPKVQAMLERLQAVSELSKTAARIKGMEQDKLRALGPERKFIEDKIELYKEAVEGGKAETKELIKEVQSAITDYAKKALPLTEAGAREIGPILTLIKNAQTPEDVVKAFNRIDELAGITSEKQERRKHVAKVNRLLKWMTGLKKVGTRRVGKFNYEDTKAFQELKNTNKEVTDLTRTMNSTKATAEEKTEAEAKLEGLWNEINEKPNKTSLDDATMKLIELRRLGSKASPALAKAVSEELEAIYSEAKDAKSEADIEKSISRKADKEFIQEFVEDDKLKNKPLIKRAITKLNNFTANTMGNWETLMTVLGGTKARDKFSLILNQVEEEMGIQESFNKVLDKAQEDYNLKSRNTVLKHIQKLKEEKYELRKPNRAGKVGKGDPKPISTMNIIDIYNAVKNEDIADSYYMSYGDITLTEDGSRDMEAQRASGKQRIDALIDNLSAADKAFGDSMMEVVNTYKESTREVFIKMFNRDMDFVENYWPSTAEFESDVDVMDKYFTEGKMPTATQQRATGRTPRPVDAFDKFNKHVKESEWYKNMALPLDRINKIFKDQNTQDLISEARGEGFLKTIQTHFKNLGLGASTRDLTDVERIGGNILGNWVSSKIGLTPSVPFKQLTSMINYAENMPVGQWGLGFTKGLATPKKTFDWMWENVPYLQDRFKGGYSEALQYAMNATSGMPKATNTQQAIKNVATIGTRGGDIAAIVYGGKPYIDYLMKKGMSKDEAINKFMLDTLRSQQSPFSSTLSTYQNSKNPFAKALFTFANTPSQYMRKMFEASQAYRHGDISAAQLSKIYAIYGVANQFLYVGAGALVSALMRGTDPEEKLGVNTVVQSLTSLVAGIPMVRDLVNTTLKRATGLHVYDDALPVIGELDKIGELVVKAIDGKKPEENIEKAFILLMEMGGIPAGNAKKLWDATVNREEVVAKTVNYEVRDKLNELKDSKNNFEARMAKDIKQAHSTAKSKATRLRNSGKTLQADRIDQLIEDSKLRLRDNDYKNLGSELRMFNIQLDSID